MIAISGNPIELVKNGIHDYFLFSVYSLSHTFSILLLPPTGFALVIVCLVWNRRLRLFLPTVSSAFFSAGNAFFSISLSLSYSYSYYLSVFLICFLMNGSVRRGECLWDFGTIRDFL